MYISAVEALIRKHAEFDKLVRAQEAKVEELKKFAEELLGYGHFDRKYIERRLANVAGRLHKLKVRVIAIFIYSYGGLYNVMVLKVTHLRNSVVTKWNSEGI